MRRLFALVGVALAVGGQAVLMNISGDLPNERSMQALAGALFVVGALLFGALMPLAVKHPPRLEFPRRWVSAPATAWRSRWLLGWLALALVLGIVADALFITDGESTAVIVLWILSMVTLMIAMLRDIRTMRPHIARRNWAYVAVLVVVLVVALAMRVYHLTTLPYNLDGDFADVGLQARALASGQEPFIFAYGWASIPMLGFLPAWFTMTLFGTGLAGMNASGVIEGILILIGVYLLGRDLFHARVGLFAAALLTISYTHLAASRQSSYIDPVFFLTYALYFLLLGLRKGKGWALVASGIMTAFCFQVYYSGRIVAFIVAFMLVYLLLFRRRWLFARAWVVVLWGFAVLIALGPMLVVFLRDTDNFMSRTNAVFILSPEITKHMEGVYGVDNIPALMLEQARHALLLFNYYPDKGTQFALTVPFLDPFTAVLLFLGVGFALVRWRWVSYASILAWTLLGMIVGCFLTVNAPFWPRLMILLPPVGLLAALALDAIYESVWRGLKRVEKHTVVFAPVALALFIVGVGILNWNVYIKEKATFATPASSMSRYIDAQVPTARAYIVSDNFDARSREFEFIAPGRFAGNLTRLQVESDIPRPGTPTFLLLSREQSVLIPYLQQRYPGEYVQTIVGNSPGEVAFYVFRLPPATPVLVYSPNAD